MQFLFPFTTLATASTATAAQIRADGALVLPPKPPQPKGIVDFAAFIFGILVISYFAYARVEAWRERFRDRNRKQRK